MSSYFKTLLTDLLGGICFPMLFGRLQPLIGFRHATWSVALVILVTLTIPIGALRMRSRPQHIRRIFDVKAWTEVPFSLWGSYLFISLCGLYLPSFFIQLYDTKFMEGDLALYLLPALNAGSFFGRLVSQFSSVLIDIDG